MSDLPEEPDRAEGAPHPREAAAVIGHIAAQSAFLDAAASGRLHHAWLIGGPPGIGKATLAWRVARFLLALAPPTGPGLFGEAASLPETLDTDPTSPVDRRITALSEPGLFLLRRGWDDKARPPRLRQVITVAEVRRLKGFFTMSRPDGGRRVVIIDSADDLNPNAANALLKLLEEPPRDTVFLLVSHMPSRLLPTIRSRCRTLTCAPLSGGEVRQVLAAIAPDLDTAEADRLARLSGGSAGAAWRLHMLDGVALSRALDDLIAGMPGVDRMRALALAAPLAQRGGEERRALFLQLVDEALAALARQGMLGTPDPVRARLAPSPTAGRVWAAAQGNETARVRRGLAVNLDPQSLILDMVLRIDKIAADCAALR